MTTLLPMLAASYLLVVAVVAMAAAAGLRCHRAAVTGAVIAQTLLVANAVADLLGLVRGQRPDEPATHIGYLLTSVALLPLLAAIVPNDSHRPRPLHAALAVACLTAVVVVARLDATR